MDYTSFKIAIIEYVFNLFLFNKNKITIIQLIRSIFTNIRIILNIFL